MAVVIDYSHFFVTYFFHDKNKVPYNTICNNFYDLLTVWYFSSLA